MYLSQWALKYKPAPSVDSEGKYAEVEVRGAELNDTKLPCSESNMATTERYRKPHQQVIEELDVV